MGKGDVHKSEKFPTGKEPGSKEWRFNPAKGAKGGDNVYRPKRFGTAHTGNAKRHNPK